MRVFSFVVLLAIAVACAPPPAAPTSAPPAAGPAPATPAAAAPPRLESARAAYVSPSGTFVGLWLAKDLGLFEKYGLDVDITYIAGGQIVVGSLLAGELQFAEMAAPTPMSALLEGADVVWLTGTTNRPLQILMAAPEITRIEDLRGRAAGVTRLGSTSHTFLKLALRTVGLDPEHDVQALQTGGVPETVAAIQTGRVAAGMMGPPTHLVAVEAGQRVLLNTAELGIPWPYAGTAATRAYIAEQPGRVRSYVKAYTEALHVARTDRERAISAMMKYGDISDRAMVEQSYDIIRPYFNVPPYPDPAAMETVIREELIATNPRARELPPQAYYDDRFVRELDESGFMQQLGSPSSGGTPPRP